MDMRIGLLLGFMCFQLLATAQAPVIVGQNQKFVYQNDNSGFVIIETLQPGMTLYRLSQKYNVAMDAILAVNPDIDPTSIPLNFPINIPIKVSSISFQAPPPDGNHLWLCYRVQPKETLYRISKVYLNTAPETITALNPSSQAGLSIGQVLHIGWYTPGTDLIGEEALAGAKPDTTAGTPKDYIKEGSNEGLVVREQKGLAVWKPGPVTSHYYVLHQTAKVGTYMEITNPMLHRTITAKVSGNIPQGLYQSHVGIVVSPSTARALGVLDQQFFARWRYLEKG